MKNPILAACILGGEGVSLVVTGEEVKINMLKGMLKSINQSVNCNTMLLGGRQECQLTVRIPSMGVEAMRQRVVSALEQCGLDIQPLQPELNHEKPDLPE